MSAVPMAQDHDPVDSAERPSPSPSLHHARDQSKATWVRDLQGLYEHAKQRFADVKWIENTKGEIDGCGEAEYLRDGSGSIGAEAMDQLLEQEPLDEDSFVNESEDIFAHKAIVYARAPKAFKTRFFPILLAGGSNASTRASVAPQSSLSSASVPNLSQQGFNTERPASRDSFLPRPSSRPRGVSLTQSTSELNFDHPGSNGHAIALERDDLTASRPATASSYLVDDQSLPPYNMDGDGRMTLSHHGLPEMLKQGLQWLYTAEGSLDELSADGLGISASGSSIATLSQEMVREDAVHATGLISAKGVDGKNSVQGKKLAISRMRLAQVSLRVVYFKKRLTGISIPRI